MDKKIRVLLVSNLYPDKKEPAKGIFVRNIEQSLLMQGFDIERVVKKNTKSRLTNLLFYVSFYFEAIYKLLFYRFDIVYLHYISHCAFPVLITRIFGKKSSVFCHVHGSDVLPEAGTGFIFSKVKTNLSKIILKRAKKIIVPSSYYKKVLYDKFNVGFEKIFISPSGGIDLNIFKPVVNAPKNRSILNIGYVGRLSEDKGIVDFVNLIAKLKVKFDNLNVVIVGDGPLRGFVEKAKVELAIDYIPSLDQINLAEIYQKLDMFIFPSRRESESLGLVGIEAMACGTPVVAYQMAGPKTYIDNGKSGFLVEPGDIDGIVEVVEHYIDLTAIEKKAISDEALIRASEFCSEKVRRNLALFFKRNLL